MIGFMVKLGLTHNRSESNFGLLNNTTQPLIHESGTESIQIMTSNRLSDKRMTISESEVNPTNKTMNGETSLTPGGISSSFGAGRIDHTTSDEAFKANYSPDILSRKSTLTLKTSFHLINVTLISLCKVFQII